MQPPIATFCSSRAAGGLELNVIRMAAWLREAGYPIQMIAADASEIARQAHAQKIPLSTISGSFSGSAVWQLRQIIAKKHFRVLFVHTSKDLRKAVLANLLTRRKTRLVFVQHMQIGMAKKDPIHTWFFRRLSAWIAPLPYLARQVAQMTRFDQTRIREIPFGIEITPLTTQKPCQTRARLQLELPTEGIFAGMIGRFDRLKNQALLLRAAAGAHPRRLAASAIACGS